MITTPIQIKYILRTVFFAVCLLVAGAVSAANVIFEYTFGSGGPTTPIRDYANRDQSDEFYTRNEGTWNMGYGRIAGYWKSWGEGAVSRKQFIFRDLKDGQVIPYKEFAEDLSLTIDMRWLWGSERSSQETYLGFLDEAGNGYAAVFKRNGEVEFYEISSPGTWEKIDILVPLSITQNANEKVTLVFFVTANDLRLSATKGSTSDVAVCQLTFANQRHLQLSEFFIGASQGNYEEIILSRISVSAESIMLPLMDHVFPAGGPAKPVQQEPSKALSDYFFSDVEGSWHLGHGGLNGRWKSWGDNPAPRRQFLYRNLRDSGHLGADSYLSSSTLGIDTRWLWGIAKASYVTYLGLLDAEGNGHVAEVSRGGDVNFYEVTSSGAWYPQGTSMSLGLSQERNERISLRFRVTPTGLELFAGNGTDVRCAIHRFSDGDNRHLELVTLMLGAGQGNNEEILIDRLYVTAKPKSGELFRHDFPATGPVESIKEHVDREDSLYFFSTQEGLWNQGYNRIAGKWKDWGEGAVGRTHFIYRDIRDGIVEVDEAYPLSPVLTVESHWLWGAGNSNQQTYLGLLDANGDGYAAMISRNGSVRFHTVTGYGTLTAQGAAQSVSFAQGSNVKQRLDFQYADGILSLTATQGNLSETVTAALTPGNGSVFQPVLLMLGASQGNYEEIVFTEIALSSSAIGYDGQGHRDTQSAPVVIDGSAYGVVPDTGENMTDKVWQMLRSIRGRSDVTISLPHGRYDFWPLRAGAEGIGFDIDSVTNLIIDGNGSEFIFHGLMQPFRIENSDAVTLENFSVDWERPFITQGVILNATSYYVDIDIDEDAYPYVIEGNQFYGVGEDWKLPILPWNNIYDKDTKEIVFRTRDNPLRINRETTEQVIKLANGAVRFYVTPTFLPEPGTYIALNHGAYIRTCINIRNSRNIVIRDVNLYHALSHALAVQRTENIHLDNFNLLANESKGRVFSSVADGFHMINNKGQVLIENLTQTGTGDDFLNLRGNNSRVQRIVDSHTMIVDRANTIGVGDEVWVVNQSNPQRGEVLNVTKVGVLPQANAVVRIITFAEDISHISPNRTFLENKTWNADLIVRNCIIQKRHRARGLLVTTPGKVIIEDNYFRSAGTAILIDGDTNYWYESGGVRDVTIRNNVFEDCLTSGSNSGGKWEWGEAIITITPSHSPASLDDLPYHNNISITDNLFKTFDVPLLRARSVGSLSFENNLIERTYTLAPFAWQQAAFWFDGCRDVNIEGNTYDMDYEGDTIWVNQMRSTDISVNDSLPFVIEPTPLSHMP